MKASRQPKPSQPAKREKDAGERSEGTGEGSSSAYARMKRQSEQRARQRPADERDNSRD